MSAAAVGLVLAAAVLHASWNLLLHGETDRVAAMALSGLIGGVVLLPFAVADPPTEVLGLAAASGAAETVYGLALSAAYARGAIALAYPVGRGTAPLLATVGAWVTLGQSPRVLDVLGAALLGGGLLALGAEARRARTMPVLGYAVLVGVAIASYSVIDGRAVASTSPLGYLSIVLLVQGVATTALLRFDVGRLRTALRPGALIAVGSVGAYALILFAFRLAPVGPVATLREVSVLLAVAMSPARRDARTWVAASLTVAGAVAVVL